MRTGKSSNGRHSGQEGKEQQFHPKQPIQVTRQKY